MTDLSTELPEELILAGALPFRVPALSFHSDFAHLQAAAEVRHFCLLPECALSAANSGAKVLRRAHGHVALVDSGVLLLGSLQHLFDSIYGPFDAAFTARSSSQQY